MHSSSSNLVTVLVFVRRFLGVEPERDMCLAERRIGRVGLLTGKFKVGRKAAEASAASEDVS